LRSCPRRWTPKNPVVSFAPAILRFPTLLQLVNCLRNESGA
jgi:hypothetical protein